MIGGKSNWGVGCCRAFGAKDWLLNVQPHWLDQFGAVSLEWDRCDFVDVESGGDGQSRLHRSVDEILIAFDVRIEPGVPPVARQRDWVAVVDVQQLVDGIRGQDGRGERP